MEDRALADRLIAYADAVVAVSVVGLSGISIALADPDVRCSLIHGTKMVVAGNLVFAGVLSLLLVVFRNWESDLRSAIRPSPRSARYLRRLHVGRLAVVWLCAILIVVMLSAAAKDLTCGT